MAKQTINLGSGPNTKTGDPLRTAFTKINSNFTELYDGASNDTSLPYLELTQRAFIVQDVTLGSTVTFTKADGATGEETIDDIIPDILALTRGNNGGLFNPYFEEQYNNSTHESPVGTLWNADGWGDDGFDVNYRNRTYVPLREALDYQIGNNIIGAELIMWDTVNNSYYKFSFTDWGQSNAGGFAYTRQLINDPNNFTKTNNGSEIDIIVPNNPVGSGIGITRGNNEGIYNTYQEEGWDWNDSPLGTTWNADGWNDLTNITTRTYTNFSDAVGGGLGRNVLNKEFVMYVEDTDTYYAIKFNSWTQGINGQSQGGGFSYSRYEIDMDQLQEGITFADGTIQKTAYDPNTPRVKSTASAERRIEEVTGNKTVSVTDDSPVVWWNKSDLPGGSSDFRGAIIEYHAFTGEATFIGTIHIVDDDGEEHITHTEVSSGDTDSENDDLWLVQNEGTISYRRLDGESKTLRIHWIAKVFYGDQYYDD